MSADKRARLRQWLESGEAQVQPLTFSQRELWETSPVPVTDPAHHICCLIEIRGLITERDCRAAIGQVVERQEALRLSFLPGKEGPLQMIRKTGDVNFTVREVSGAEAHPERIEEMAAAIFREPFDLVQGPLFRVVMLRRAADDHVLVFAIHHAIADGWTLGVFVQDLFAAYVQAMMAITDPLPPVPLSYSVWGASERAYWQPAVVGERAAFWKATLAGSRRLWSEPIGHGPARRSVTHVPAEVAGEVRELARRTGATLFSALLAVFQVAFSRWNGVDDIVVGTPVANRTKQAVRETMGYCSGIVPLRVRIDRTALFSDHLRATHEMTVNSFANAMPFAELVRALGEPASPGVNPVFEIRFALQNHPIPEVSFPTLGAKMSMRSTGTPRFQLACEITEERDRLEVVWLYRDTVFSPDDIAALDRIFQDTLSSACRSPAALVSEFLN